MKIVNDELVKSVDWANDQILSKLCTDEEHFIIVNPEFNSSILKLINVDICLTDSCVKYKIGEGWIAKRFPKQWNGHVQIIQLRLTPHLIETNKYAVVNSKILDYKVPAWDLPYKHVWTYNPILTNGVEVDAVTVSYIESATGRKVIGVADTEYINNLFDVIFLVYNETTAEDNWNRLQEVCPRAKRVIGIKGIYNAHMAAATIAQTEMFYVVDADAYIKDFKFDYVPLVQDREKVHIWHSHNPVNGLEYGYGGVKLFSKSHFQELKKDIVDVATSVGPVKVIPQVACNTRFNTGPFNTWKSAFRECVKLGAMVINNQDNFVTAQRLNTWCNTGLDSGVPNAVWAIEGAVAGRCYGKDNAGNLEALKKINDFNWLAEQFKKNYEHR